MHYSKSAEEVLAELEVSLHDGLSSAQAAKRLVKYGANTLKEKEREKPLITFLLQFKSVPVFLLATASLVSVFLGEYIEAAAIAAILLINAIIGLIQERKAGDAIAALKKLSALKVKVLRDGTKQLVDADAIVPGDIIFLETGDKIPADARIIEARNSAVLESTLTGESQPVSKHSSVIESKKSVGDQKNMVFSGTVITAGRITAVVTSTGMNTEIGKIAAMLSAVEEDPTPLQKKVDDMVHKLSVAVLCISILVFIALLITLPDTTDRVFQSLITSVALAVAALPEGLPIVLTITSAIGIKRMVKRNVLIRRLMSVETLGSVTVICTDKTGTLTKNQMTVQKLYVNGTSYDITGDGYESNGTINAPESTELTYLLTCGVLCNNASVFKDKVTGDPTELALIVSATKGSLNKDSLEEEYPRIAEKEFTSERKLMSTVNSFGGQDVLFCKGAADELLHRCSRILERGDTRVISEDDKKRILTAAKEYSDEALRVLGFAYKEATNHEEQDLIFIGLQAMMDPPREEVRGAIERCKQAGIRVVMITGDHPDTAAAVARKLGLDVKVLTGKDLDNLHDIDTVVEEVIIYARVNPEHKIAIVSALQRKGHVVAMTGDGVNDAPALKKADIGIAMGITGTDVAKEAGQMIITNDNFTSIVSAVEEGRSIYNNIRRFIRYQLSTNVGAILLVLATIFTGLPLPLLPLQLLWINLSIDGPPALSLGLEPSNPDVLKRKPRPRTEPLITKELLVVLILGGVIMAAGTFFVFEYFLKSTTYVKATTMAFTTFTLFQFFNVLNCRSLHSSIFRIGLFTNKMAWWAIGVTFAINLTILYVPFLQEIFHTTSLSILELLMCLFVASSILVLFEIKKFFLAGRLEEHEAIGI